MTEQQKQNIFTLIESGKSDNMEMAMQFAMGLGDQAFIAECEKRIEIERFIPFGLKSLRDTTRQTINRVGIETYKAMLIGAISQSFPGARSLDLSSIDYTQDSKMDLDLKPEFKVGVTFKMPDMPFPIF